MLKTSNIQLGKYEKRYIKEMAEGFKLGVFGSRVLSGLKVDAIINEYIDKYSVKEIVTATNIGGVCGLARDIAHHRGIAQKLFAYDNKRFAGGCYHFRSILIGANSDRILIIWDGKSRGTKGELEMCKKYGWKYDLFKIKEEEDYSLGRIFT